MSLTGRFILCAFCAWIGADADQCAAQPRTSVQLPTFENFRASTTVIVPDRGSAHLGGVGGARLGQRRSRFPIGQRFPAPANAARARSLGAADVSLHATIHDHREMDRRLLAGAAQRPSATQNQGTTLVAAPTAAGSANRTTVFHRWHRLAEAAGYR